MRHLFTVQYLGTRYAGWQSQENAVGVQDVLQDALAEVAGERVVIHGAGRTDSGVHARAQTFHADIPVRIRPLGLILGMNNRLPRDIRVVAVHPVRAGFHARFDAIGKRYVYRIWNARVADVFHAETHAHVALPLDEVAMQRAGLQLVGEHDFRSFTVARPTVSSTVRTVRSVVVTRDGARVTIEVSADGFLRYMVRRIAGTLIEIGRGALEEEAIAAALEPRFETARWTAPAAGLTLEEVVYGDAIGDAPPGGADDAA